MTPIRESDEETRSLSIIIALTGQFDYLENDALILVEHLHDFLHNQSIPIELIFVVDGLVWQVFSEQIIIPKLNDLNPKIVSIMSEGLPAKIFNQGVKYASNRLLSFMWPGCEMRIDEFTHQLFSIDHFKCTFIAGIETAAGEARSSKSFVNVCDIDDLFLFESYQNGFMQLFDMVPMHQSIVKADIFRELGCFCESDLFQRAFWWDFCLRYSAVDNIRSYHDKIGSAKYHWSTYPLLHEKNNTTDEITRALMHRQEAVIIDNLNIKESKRKYADQKSTGQIGKVERNLSTIGQQADEKNQVTQNESSYVSGLFEIFDRPLRVTIVGGINEAAHNQICFYNYFLLLHEEKSISWKSVYDINCTPKDLLSSDIVVFSRVRSSRGKELLTFCQVQNIKTIYMIDDNWFCIGKEWPQYKEMFSPGKEPYENFLCMLRNVDCVLTYNPLMEQDILQYNSNVIKLEVNVNLEIFKKDHVKAGEKESKIIAYFGSARQNNPAFEAMVAVAKECSNVSLFLMTTPLPDIFNTLPQDKLIHHPYSFSYRNYIHIINRISPDIAVAPLTKNRFEASKCPNKFLEISAFKVLGVYSDVEPYSNYVENWETGILVDNSYQSWQDVLHAMSSESLSSLRNKMIENSYNTIKAKYDTSKRLDDFVCSLKALVCK